MFKALNECCEDVCDRPSHVRVHVMLCWSRWPIRKPVFHTMWVHWSGRLTRRSCDHPKQTWQTVNMWKKCATTFTTFRKWRSFTIHFVNIFARFFLCLHCSSLHISHWLGAKERYCTYMSLYSIIPYMPKIFPQITQLKNFMTTIKYLYT